MRRLLVAAIALPALTLAAQATPAAATQFDVRIENVSTRQTLRMSNGTTAPVPFSPVIWAVHSGGNPLFTPGAVETGLGLKGFAEAGIGAPFLAAIKALPSVHYAGLDDHPNGHRRGMPKGEVDRKSASHMLQEGQRFEFTVSARRGDRLSLAMMIGQSNDGLVATGRDGIDLFDAAGAPVNGNVTLRLSLWDAGTEVNEDPGLGRNQGLRQGAAYAGDPERSPVRPMSEAEFGSLWPAVDRLVKVTITTRK